MVDQIPVFSMCPHCGEKAYDRLRTHAYCAECNYSPDFDEGPAVPEWAIRYARETKASFVKAMNDREEKHDSSNDEEPSAPPEATL